MIHKLVKVRGADFCDDQFPIISTIGRGPKGEDAPIPMKFADPIEWDANSTYNSFTVVMHNGNSYISKQSVPAGVDISDDEYWVLSGPYNAQIEQYRRETDQALQAAQDAQDDIDNIDMLLPKLESAIENQRKGIVVIGDSYGEGYTPDGRVTSWIQVFTSFATSLDYDVFSTYRGGSGFWNNSSTYRFATLLTELISTMTSEQKDSVGTVIIGGGYNDKSNSASNIALGMAGARDVIAANFPNVRRVLIFPFGMGVQGLTTGDHASFTYDTIVAMNKNYIEQSANTHFGSVVANSCMVLRRNLYFSSDYVHPNQNGQFLLGRFVIDTFMQNGYNTSGPLNYNSTYNIPITYDEGITANNPLSIITNNDSFTIYRETNSIQFTFETPIPSLVLDANPLDLATIKDAAIQQNYADFRIPISYMIRYNDGSAKYRMGVGALQFRFGKLSIIAWELNDTLKNFGTITNVDQINCQLLSHPSFNGLYLR